MLQIRKNEYLTEYICDGIIFIGPEILASSFEEAYQKASDSNLRIVGEIVSKNRSEVVMDVLFGFMIFTGVFFGIFSLLEYSSFRRELDRYIFIGCICMVIFSGITWKYLYSLTPEVIKEEMITDTYKIGSSKIKFTYPVRLNEIKISYPYTTFKDNTQYIVEVPR